MQCIHHWMIDRWGLGRCKKCGEVRQFINSWNGVVALLRKGMGLK